MISALSEPTQPSQARVTNCGTSASCIGIMKVASTIQNSTLRPGKSYLAKAKAASESRSNTRNVTAVATTTVMPIDFQKSIPSNTLFMFSHRWGPGSSSGG
jgi:hypothetical protein